MLTIKILTLFPEFFDSFLSNSIIKRAIAKKAVAFQIINIRDYSLDKNHRIDDRPVGGGAGLIMRMQPLVSCLKANVSSASHTILLSPLGEKYDQEKAINLSKEQEIILICGHYEGIDSRFNEYVDELVSIGDYILTGGEIGAMIISDSVTRLLKGAISQASIEEESFTNGLLEYPQYTLPYDYEGYLIPEILFSGNHKAISIYRQRESLRLTQKYRPDLMKKYHLSKDDKKRLAELQDGNISKEEKEALIKGKKYLK
ncbi:MAG: tRNA (guanosine(37)-N1)-methyltransferase TrmD [Bacilli bacterium]|nr:tRNA (guanosine(37)-N1)-methyltransferase TrmD [Bacilli bacterium]